MRRRHWPAEAGEVLQQFLFVYVDGVIAVSRFMAEMIDHLERQQNRCNHEDYVPNYALFPEETHVEALASIGRSLQELKITHSVAIFDSFLNSVSRFVMYHRASKVLGDTSCEVRELLGKTADEILKRQIDRKAEALSRQSFVQRIRALEGFLETSFGHTSEQLANLKKIVAIRNLITHEMHSYEISFDQNRSVTAVRMQEVSDDQLMIEVEILERLVPPIYRSVVAALYQRDILDREESFLVVLEDWKASAACRRTSDQ